MKKFNIENIQGDHKAGACGGGWQGEGQRKTEKASLQAADVPPSRAKRESLSMQRHTHRQAQTDTDTRKDARAGADTH